MNYSDLAPPHIRAIAPYQPGKPIAELERELGITGIVKLASNENPLGCSPLAVAAMHEAIKTIALYPDGNGFELKDALSRRYGVEHARIVLGNGSNDMLELAARAFLTVGDKAVYSAHAFAVYPLATQAVGATGISVPAINFGHDLKAMLKAAVEQQAKLVFIANPNNPTGTFLSAADLLDFMRALPPQILVVLDEAYNEYLPVECRYDSVSWLKDFPNLIISRTFSKAYGLAGLRVGYALANRAGGRHDEPRAPAVQRQQRGAGRGRGGLAGRGFRQADPRIESARHGTDHAWLGQAGAGIYSVLGQLRQF